MDLFSQPFYFRFGKKDQKRKTKIGSCISIFVLVTSLGYLAYLIYAYVNNEFQPTITYSSNSVTEITQVLDYSPIMWKFHLPPDATSQDPYFIQYVQLDEGTTSSVNLTYTDCANVPKNSNYSLYNCIDIVNNDVEMYIDSDGNYNQIFLRITKCEMLDRCENVDAIQEILKSRQFDIEILIAYEMYDVEKGEVSLVVDRKSIPGDTSVVGAQTIQFVQTELDIDTGFLWAVWETQLFTSSYSLDNIPLSQEFIRDKYSLTANMVGQFEIRMKLQQDLIQVQWMKFSTLIAMFLSIFDTLLALGVIASMSSEAMIYQGMMDTFLKEYYKQTADELQQLNDKRKQEIQDAQAKIDSKAIRERLQSMNDNILAADSEISAFKHYFAPGGAPAKKEPSAKVATSNSVDQQRKAPANIDDVYRHIWHKLPDLMNATGLYTEIFRLKTALQLLFSPEQYAALGLVSRRVPDYDTIEETNFESLNHVEKLDIMEDSEHMKNPQMEKFIERMRTQPQSASELDRRIWSSLLAYVRNQGGQDQDQYGSDQKLTAKGQRTGKQQQGAMENFDIE